MTQNPPRPQAPRFQPALPERDLRTALFRGWSRRCPACGEGALFDGYLDVRHECGSCHTDLSHQRADDGPAWATIMVAGHIMAPVMLIVFEAFRPKGWQMAVGFSIVFVALSLYLLPRIKGCFVGIQWAKRMHGFGENRSQAASTPGPTPAVSAAAVGK
jgi:uncharacterized protein (DUF983 family)